MGILRGMPALLGTAVGTGLVLFIVGFGLGSILLENDISRSTWHKLKRQGKAPAIVNIGGIQRIRREAIETWLAENEERATADAAHNAVEGAEPLHV